MSVLSICVENIRGKEKMRKFQRESTALNLFETKYCEIRSNERRETHAARVASKKQRRILFEGKRTEKSIESRLQTRILSTHRHFFLFRLPFRQVSTAATWLIVRQLIKFVQRFVRISDESLRLTRQEPNLREIQLPASW